MFAVVLAAGRSSRTGQPKGLVAHAGRPWLAAQLDALARVDVKAVVVLGFDRADYDRAMPDLPGRVRVVVNPHPERGPFTSLQCGLSAVDLGAAVYVLPVDVPAPVPTVWAALAAALDAPAGSTPSSGAPSDPRVDAVVPTFEGRGGHPVLLSPAFASWLRGRPESSRLDLELSCLVPPRLVRVPVHDPGIRLNLNAPEDWAKLGPHPAPPPRPGS